MWAMGSALKIEGLRYRYPGTDRDVVDVPALELGRGEQVLLTGGSGRGKSTLLHLIAGLIEPSSGTVRVAGQEMHRLRGAKRDEFRGAHVGMIFQTFNLLRGFSAIENVMVAMMFSHLPRREHRARAGELLTGLGIDRHGADPEQMSIGQQQRVAVARAVACHPAIVLADEPTASLDPENGTAAMDLIQSVCKAQDAALVCVSHDPAMAERFANRKSLDEIAGGAAVGEGA